MNMSNIVKEAKKVQNRSNRRDTLTDEEALDLIIAYANGDINNSGISAVLKKRGFKMSGGNGVSILGSRAFKLIRQGRLEIKKK